MDNHKKNLIKDFSNVCDVKLSGTFQQKWLCNRTFLFFCKTNHRPIFLLYLLNKKKEVKKERKVKKKNQNESKFSLTKRSKPPCCYVLYVKSIACYLFNDISLFIVLLIYICYIYIYFFYFFCNDHLISNTVNLLSNTWLKIIPWLKINLCKYNRNSKKKSLFMSIRYACVNVDYWLHILFI